MPATEIPRSRGVTCGFPVRASTGDDASHLPIIKIPATTQRLCGLFLINIALYTARLALQFCQQKTQLVDQLRGLLEFLFD